MSSLTKEKFLLTTKWSPHSFPLLTIALQFGPIDLLPTYTHYTLASFIYTFLIHFNSIPNELFAITKKQQQQKTKTIWFCFVYLYKQIFKKDAFLHLCHAILP